MCIPFVKLLYIIRESLAAEMTLHFYAIYYVDFATGTNPLQGLSLQLLFKKLIHRGINMENVFRKIYIGINRAKLSKVENKGQVRKKRYFQVHTELFFRF